MSFLNDGIWMDRGMDEWTDGRMWNCGWMDGWRVTWWTSSWRRLCSLSCCCPERKILDVVVIFTNILKFKSSAAFIKLYGSSDCNITDSVSLTPWRLWFWRLANISGICIDFQQSHGILSRINNSGNTNISAQIPCGGLCWFLVPPSGWRSGRLGRSRSRCCSRPWSRSTTTFYISLLSHLYYVLPRVQIQDKEKIHHLLKEYCLHHHLFHLLLLLLRRLLVW